MKETDREKKEPMKETEKAMKETVDLSEFQESIQQRNWSQKTNLKLQSINTK